MKPKNNAGPRITTYIRKPKSRCHANRVWVAAQAVFGQPPSWLRMVPPRRWIEDREGNKIFTTTSRWEIGRTENDTEPIVVEGSAKSAEQILLKRREA